MEVAAAGDGGCGAARRHPGEGNKPTAPARDGWIRAAMGNNSETGLDGALGGFAAGAAVAQLVSCLPAGIWAHREGGTGGTGKWREMAPGGEFTAVTKLTLSQRKATAPRSPGLTALPG